MSTFNVPGIETRCKAKISSPNLGIANNTKITSKRPYLNVNLC